ncbi:MAG: hypothetical protein ACYTG0_19865 [Planctomycetota bacterium]|jgi:hypothetical protein
MQHHHGRQLDVTTARPASIVFLTAVSILAAGAMLAGPPDGSRPLSDAALAELTFEESGRTYYLIRSSIYRRDDAAGRLVFFDDLYDPDFLRKNYETVNGVVHKKAPGTGKLYATRRQFRDGFENAAGVLDLMGERRGWTNLTLQSPPAPTVPSYNALKKRILSGEGDFIDNRVEPTTEIAHTGKSSLKCYCVPKSPGMVTTKASLDTSLLHFIAGDDVWFSGWFYLADGGRPFTLVDLETTWMFQHPGIRICLAEDGCLFVELKWPGKPKYRQEAGRRRTFPVERWVHLELHLRLTANQEGLVELWQDDVLVVEATGQTLPLDVAVYDKLEVGISAHNHRDAALLYVDDIAISADPLQ